MDGLDPFDEDSGGTVFRDVILLALLGFVAIVLLLLPHVNPKAKVSKDVKSPGNVIVEIRWPDWLNTDVDLWVMAPGDVPVGYSKQSGRVFNLLRDDLGHRRDDTRINHEISYSRGVAEGEYTVNVHLYSNISNVYPIPVTVVVSVKGNAQQPARQILSSRVNLNQPNQEITVFRFKLRKDGALVPGSIHSVPRALRGRAG